MREQEEQLQKLLKNECSYIILDSFQAVEGQYPPYILENKEERILYLFSRAEYAREQAASLAKQFQEDIPQQDGKELEPFPIALLSNSQLLAILMEYALHGGEEVRLDVQKENICFPSISGVNVCYMQLGRPPFLKGNQVQLLPVFMEVLKEERKLFTMPSGGTRGEDILNNTFIPFDEDGKIVFFAEEEQALAYYDEKNMPEDWNLGSNFRQMVQVLLYSYDKEIRELVLYYKEERIEIALDPLFWMLQRMGRPENYILLKPYI